MNNAARWIRVRRVATGRLMTSDQWRKGRSSNAECRMAELALYWATTGWYRIPNYVLTATRQNKRRRLSTFSGGVVSVST